MANYEQMGDTVLVNEADLEIKVVPTSSNVYTVQIASQFIRGTLIIDAHMDKEDLDEVVEHIYTIIDEISFAIPDNQQTQ